MSHISVGHLGGSSGRPHGPGWLPHMSGSHRVGWRGSPMADGLIFSRPAGASWCVGLQVPKCSKRASPSGQPTQVCGSGFLLSCWWTQRQCGKGLHRGTDAGQQEQLVGHYCHSQPTQGVCMCCIVSAPKFGSHLGLPAWGDPAENQAGCPNSRVFREATYRRWVSLEDLTIIWSPFQLFIFWSFEL